MANKPLLITRIFSGVWRLILLVYALILLAVLVGVPVVVYFAFFHEAEVSVPARAALVWAPTGELVEQQDNSVGSFISSAVSQPQEQSVVRDLIAALDRARSDDRIKSVFVKLDELAGAQPGQLQDLVGAIDRFKKAGKPVIAWSSSFDQAQYQLASHADKIYLDPFGYVFLPGYGVYRSYYKDAIDKLGVTVNVFRVGKFKSFVEPYTRNDMSPAARQANLVWMNELWRIYRQSVASARQTTPQAISEYTAKLADRLQASGGDTAQTARKAGLVDQVASLSQVRGMLEKRVGTDAKGETFNQISAADYVQATPDPRAARPSVDHIATVVVQGEIVDGESVPGSAGGDTVARLIASARRDAHVKALLLRVNSPGGSITASDRIRREVVATRAAGKPVVVSMAGLAASGGYWISMNANQIWAEPSTITGSIGVFAVIPTFSKPLNELGVHTDGVGTTPLSGAMRLDKPLSPMVKTILQSGIEHAYRTFVGLVAQARGLTRGDVNKIAQGRVWSGVDAKRLGLVDKLGGYVAAERATARNSRASNPGSSAIMRLQPPSSWQGALRQYLGSEVQGHGAGLARAARPGPARWPPCAAR